METFHGRYGSVWNVELHLVAIQFQSIATPFADALVSGHLLIGGKLGVPHNQSPTSFVELAPFVDVVEDGVEAFQSVGTAIRDLSGQCSSVAVQLQKFEIKSN